MTTLLQELASRQRFGMRPGLDTLTQVLSRLGNPERDIAAIHIAGTNGKGAVAALCESVLRAAGYAVGRYTSPHLVRLNERFFINGMPVSDEHLETAAQEVVGVIQALEAETKISVTFFECLTAIAFVLFRTAGIKLVVLETGLGGRLDATNVVMPLVSVVTRIGLDHCDWLGATLAQIAGEKAGIIKPGRPVICAAMPEEARATIAQVALQQQARFVDAAEEVTIAVTHSELAGQTLKITTSERTLASLRLPLAGAFQVENVAAAMAALEEVSRLGVTLPDEAFVTGFSQVCWPGRFQLVASAPPVVIDGAHNPEGARALREALRQCKIKAPIGLVAGFCGDKDALGHLRVLAPVVKCAWGVAVPNPRTLTADQCVGIMRVAGYREVKACVEVAEALRLAQAWAVANEGVVLVCGSLFLAGAALVVLGAYPWPLGPCDPNEMLKSN